MSYEPVNLNLILEAKLLNLVIVKIIVMIVNHLIQKN